MYWYADVWQDGGEGDDVKYQKSKVLTIRWTVKDEETGVKSCKWAVGGSLPSTVDECREHIRCC